jgi:Protein of unknown function (DUF3558)
MSSDSKWSGVAADQPGTAPMTIQFLATMVAAGCAISMAGCSTGPSTPQPARSSPIPPVKNPLNVAAVAGRPCELLNARQAAGFDLGLPPKQHDAAPGDLGCEWTSTSHEQDKLTQVIISTFTNNSTLEAVYDREHGRPFFELTEIVGYPTIVTRSNPDQPHCDIAVKPAEFQSVSVSYDSKLFKNNPQMACVVGKQIAVAVLMNMPPKS